MSSHNGAAAVKDAPGSAAHPVSIRPQYALQWSSHSSDVQQCAEEAIYAGANNAVSAVVSGCGQHAADIALAAHHHLAELLGSDQQLPLMPDALIGAFEQCHAKLVQQALQQPQHQHQHPLDVSQSGASCLVVGVDLDSKQLLAASAGLCHAVMARAAPGGALTVLELSPRLALGYNVAETSRLDAEGSSICYSCRTLAQCAPQPQGQQDAQSAFDAQQQLQQATCPEPVLVGPDGAPLPGVRASRLLGYTSASAAGVTATPVVTSWRLSGEDAFVVLGSPGLWAAMNPAEVVDYVAAAMASGACSMQDSGACAEHSVDVAGTASEPQQQQASAQLRPDAAVLLSDLLTLEAQERLKLRLADISTLLGLGGAAGAGTAAHQVVPDVTAIVLLLQGPLPAQQVPVDSELLQEQLSTVPRGCRSNAEAQALQARWYSSASASTCSSSTSVVAISSSGSNSSASIAAAASMSSSADSTCSTSNSAHCASAGHKGSSTGAGAAAALTGMRAQRVDANTGTCPAQSPPAPALSCLLPALTVAGHCWPATFWPVASPAVKVPAGLTGRKGSLAAAASADCAGPNSCEDSTAAACAAATSASRPVGFSLSPRLSIELDVTHVPGSSGSTGSLAAQCAAANSAADAVAAGKRSFDQLPSPTAGEDQAVIVHKVRLSGPNELESLLYGSATTSHPDTTVARILKPKLSSSSSFSGNSSLAHAYSWAAPSGFSTSGLGCYNNSMHPSSRQQQRMSGWSVGGWAAAGVPRALHHAPQRSASVNIAQLSRQLHAPGSCSSSAASSQQSYGSLKVAAASSTGRESLAGAGQQLTGRQSSSFEGFPPLAHKHSATETSGSPLLQKQQLGRVPESDVQSSLLFQAASLPAGIPTAGRVTKARSYQALSALQAAGSAGLSDSLAAAPEGTKAAYCRAASFSAAGVITGAASADAAGLLSSRSSGSGLYPHRQLQLHFRPAFRSALQATDAAAPAALQSRFSDSAVEQQQRQQQPWRLSAVSADGAMHQKTQECSSLLAQASLADSLASCESVLEQQEVPEGKVRGGLSRSRSSSLRTLTAAEALAAAEACTLQQASVSSSRADQRLGNSACSADSKVGGLAAAALADTSPTPDTTAQQDGSISEKAHRGAVGALAALQPAAPAASFACTAITDEPHNKTPLERCVRGGHTKAARLKHSLSSPELQSLPPGTSTRPRRTSAVQLPQSTAPSSSTAGTASNNQQQSVLGRASGSLPPVLHSSTSLAAEADAAMTASISPFADNLSADSAGSLLQSFLSPPQQQPVTLASAFASASATRLSPAGSRELAEGSLGADGAVHGGELGEQALEGQMHGGRRSKSMSASSLVLAASLPSSSAEDDETLTASLSPGSRQQHMHARRALRSSSYHSSLSCSSSSCRQLPLSPAGSGALPVSSGFGMSTPAAAGPAAAMAIATGSCSYGAYNRSGSMSGAVSGGLQAFASGDGVGLPEPAFASSTNECAANSSGSIEVMRMPSGSFTRVRFASSAPAGAPGEQLSSVADCITDSPGAMLAGSAQPMHGGYSSYSTGSGTSSTMTAGPVSSSAPWGTAAVKGWSSPGRHVVAFSSSAGSSDAAALRNSSNSLGGAPGLNNSLLPALPKPAWSSSRAWSGKSAARKLNSNNLFARASVSTAGESQGAVVGSGATAAAPSASGATSGFSAQLLQGAGGSSSSGPATAGNMGLTISTQGPTPNDDQGPGRSSNLVSRQRSAPLPTLQESPCCTPGTSPVSFGFAAAYEQTLARHLGVPQGQHDKQHELSKLMVMTPDVHDSDDELTVGSVVLSSLDLCKPMDQQEQRPQSYADHSATGLVMQSLTAEASRRSTDDSGSGSRCTAGCSSDGLAAEGLSRELHSDSFEFSKPQGGDAWDTQSPLLGKMLG